MFQNEQRGIGINWINGRCTRCTWKPPLRFLSGTLKSDKEALGSGARANVTSKILFTKTAFFRTHLNMFIDVPMGVGMGVYTSNLKAIHSV